MRRRGPEGKGRGGDTGDSFERLINSIERSINPQIKNLISRFFEVNRIIENKKEIARKIGASFNVTTLILDDLFNKLNEGYNDINKLLDSLNKLIEDLQNIPPQGGGEISTLIEKIKNSLIPSLKSLINTLDEVSKNLNFLKSSLNNIYKNWREAHQGEIKKLNEHINEIDGKINLLEEKLENFQQFRGQK